MFSTLGLLVLVSAIWGCTNPFIKRGTSGVAKIKSDTVCGQFYSEIMFLFTNWQYVIPFLVNQLGSILYFFALQGAQLSLAVPITNSFTFVFTALTGWMLGEQALTLRSIFGTSLIICGTTICYLS